MTKKLTLIERMRANSTMAGIVALSEHYPSFIPSEDQPTPATDYLYDSIIISSLDDITAPQRGLSKFLISIIDDILAKTINPNLDLPNASFKEVPILKNLRKQLKTDMLDTNEIYSVLSNWVAPHGGVGDDAYMYYVLRQSPEDWAESFLRDGIAKIPRLLSDWSTAEYDWWHRLGTFISYMAHGYMAAAWKASGPQLPDFLNQALSDLDRESAHEQFRLANIEYRKMLWLNEEKLFMRLADCIGDCAGRRPHRNPDFVYPS